jgi:hypothetical protein
LARAQEVSFQLFRPQRGLVLLARSVKVHQPPEVLSRREALALLCLVALVKAALPPRPQPDCPRQRALHCPLDERLRELAAECAWDLLL